MSVFEFEKLTEPDLKLLTEWLSRPHVAEWFGDPAEWIEEIEENWDSDWIWHFRVDYDGRPFGFAQCYRSDRAPEGVWSAMPPGTLGIDYLIGREEDTGKGLGRAMIAAFVDRVVSVHGPLRIIADPELDNALSVKALESLGFRLHESSGLMVKVMG